MCFVCKVLEEVRRFVGKGGVGTGEAKRREEKRREETAVSSQGGGQLL